MNDGMGKYLIVVIIAFVVIISMVFAFKAGEKVGKLQVINNVKEIKTLKGDINDLIKDFSDVNPENAKKTRNYWKY